VGELIRCAERESQNLLATAGPADATSLARGWAEVLAGAQNILETIPHSAADAYPVEHHYLTIRVARMSAQAQRFGPVGLVGHAAMSEVAHTLDEAARLVRGNAHAWLPTNPDARRDAAVARVRIAGTLANLAHVTGREIHNYTLMARAAGHANGSHGTLPKALGSQTAERWLRMMRTHEEVTLDYVNGHRGELHGQRHVPPIPASALGVQLAAWSTTSIRRVADPHVTAFDLHRIAATQANILWFAAALTAAASAQAEIDPSIAAHLHRRLDAAGSHWATTAKQWGLLQTPGSGRPDPTVMVGARAMLTSLAGVTSGPHGWCSPTQIAEQLDGTVITPLLRAVTDGSQSLAEIYVQLPHEMNAADRLRAPAAALLAIARGHDDLAAAVADYARYRDTVNQPGKPVSLIDIGTTRLHRLTPAALQQMKAGGTALTEAATTAYDAVLVNTPHVVPAGDGAAKSTVAGTPRSLPRMASSRRHPQNPLHRPHSGPGITP